MKTSVDLHIHRKHAKILPGYPDTIDDITQLEELLSRPSSAAIEALRRIEGDLIVLGVTGKLGPTLVHMAKRASDAANVPRKIIGVGRNFSPEGRRALESYGIETISGDLLHPEFVKTLPNVPNVIFMAGRKFGSYDNEDLTWAINTHLPSLICRQFSNSRIVAFSTGNVYGMAPVAAKGSLESDPLQPCGEYAMSCLGRERIFEYFSLTSGIPVALIRLNYAVEMRYGVLVDLAQKVYKEQEIDLTMGYVNVIWQGDASAMALCALEDANSPPRPINITGPELLSVREICENFAKKMGRTARFSGVEDDQALLSNGLFAFQRYGYPRVSVEQMVHWITQWILRGSPTLKKPTHYEVRNGVF
jgi:nucleoside-diphosphate-sugar epimerase